LNDGGSNGAELVGKWFHITGRRKEIFLCTKVGFALDSKVGGIWGTPEYIKQAGEASLKRLQTDQIDMLFLHRSSKNHIMLIRRADQNVPIEHTVGAMADLVKEGKVKYIGLSEISSKTLRRAHKVHPSPHKPI
jgi:aryl-alcohol dehydrogenase-like predicted oxidoreductase